MPRPLEIRMSERPAAFDTTLFRVTVRRVLLVAASGALAAFGWLLLDERDPLNAQEKAGTVLDSAHDVVARVDGQAITRADLENAVRGELAALEKRQSELYHQALEKKIDELLLAAEAKKRGVAPENVAPAGERELLLAGLRREAEVRIVGDQPVLPALR